MNTYKLYKISIGSQPCGMIIPTHGLWQGDPLTPYLFLLCAEGLSTLLNKATQRNDLKGLAASTRGPRISHLFFVDDSLIFCQATEKEGAKVQRILQVYESSSGQQLNRKKTTLFFSSNIPTRTQEAIKSLFGAQVIKPYESYLGLPLCIHKIWLLGSASTWAHNLFVLWTLGFLLWVVLCSRTQVHSYFFKPFSLPHKVATFLSLEWLLFPLNFLSRVTNPPFLILFSYL